MSDIAIRVENLSKRYRIGQRVPYKALRDTLTDMLYAPFRTLSVPFHFTNRPTPNTENPAPNSIWAIPGMREEV